MKIIRGVTTVEGTLSTLNCGSNQIIFNLAPDMELEVRNIPEQTVEKVKRMGLMVMRCATVNLNTGQISVDATKSTAVTPSASVSESTAPTEQGVVRVRKGKFVGPTAVPPPVKAAEASVSKPGPAGMKVML